LKFEAIIRRHEEMEPDMKTLRQLTIAAWRASGLKPNQAVQFLRRSEVPPSYLNEFGAQSAQSAKEQDD
jgi:hypothetical protein